MKIIHVLNSIKDCGNGITCATIDLACQQSISGHEVYIISSGGGFVELLKNNGVTHITVDQKRKPFVILKALIKLQRVFKEIKPDIVHAHMMTAVILCRIIKFINKIHLVSTIHNEFQKSANLMGLADKVIAVSSGSKKSMIKRGIPSKKIYVVRNGTIGNLRQVEIKDTDLNLSRPSITTISGLYKRKGISCVIEAFILLKKQIPQAHLYIVGDGPDRLEFECQAKKSNVLNDIHFEGFQAQPQEYLLQTDLFVLASKSETFGLVLSEAREAGCAVIGSNVGGIPEVLENGKAGQLFDVDNHFELAEIMIETLSNQDKLMFWKKKASENTEWLSVQRVCTETIEVYRK